VNDWPSRTEVLVIGGGPGGYAAAFRAADLGHQVTLVSDEVRLGGVCLLRGCIPSKALLDAAELLRLGDRARRRGIDLGEPRVDLERLRSWKNEIVEQLVGGLEGITHGAVVGLSQRKRQGQRQGQGGQQGAGAPDEGKMAHGEGLR